MCYTMLCKNVHGMTFHNDGDKRRIESWTLAFLYFIANTGVVPRSGKVCQSATNLSTGIRIPVHTKDSSDRDDVKIC